MRTEKEILEYLEDVETSIELVTQLGGFKPRTLIAFQTALAWVLEMEED